MPSPSLFSRPLCVDLDGTLVRTDLLVESVFALLKINLFYIFMLPLWLFHGKANFKHQIAQRVQLDVSLLPYHEEFLDYLRQEHARGRRLILATASNVKFAEHIALELGIFESILASEADINLSGKYKLERLQTLYGEKGFDYAGNAMVDLIVWRHAKDIIIVNPEHGVKEAAEREGLDIQLFDDRDGSSLRHYLKAMRLHQWLKNLLVFVPMVVAHQFFDPVTIGRAVLAFFSFGLCASSVYLLNDFLDLPNDRAHSKKCRRPFAAGRISVVHGAVLIPVLLILSFTLALLLPPLFLVVLAIYYTITLAYSLGLKKVMMFDVLTLAGLYTLRVIAGAAATNVEPSFWLLAFSMFLFFSLALVKRYTEMLTVKQEGKEGAAGRGYYIEDLEALSQFGSSSSHVAVLVLALYINSENVKTLYTNPEIIWLLCPLFLYLLTRIWILARRGLLHEDPVVFFIMDRRSQLLVIFAGVLVWLAI